MRKREKFTPWGLLFALVGVSLLVWSNFIVGRFANPDLAARAKNIDGSFTASQLYLLLGIGKTAVTVVYWGLSRIPGVAFIKGTQMRQFLCTLWIPLLLAAVPVLDSTISPGEFNSSVPGGPMFGATLFIIMAGLYVYGNILFLIRIVEALWHALAHRGIQRP